MNYTLPLLSALLLLSSCQKNFQYSVEQLDEKFGVYIDRLNEEEVNTLINKGLKPVALKDNIDAIGFANTAGSMALKQNFPNKNAFLVQKLVENGYFIQGKANLSEWINCLPSKC